ncbi:hypothetical protein [Polaribacter sp.]|uniref:hypothetical protein n=1 Tax=Polaribacter sp. TaxID=1920175 RepID=UPI003F6BEED1
MKFLKIAIISICLFSFLGINGQTFPKDAWGVYSWVNYDARKVNREKTPHLKGGPLILRWSKLEPKEGKFKFDRLIKQPLEQMARDDYNTFLMVWVAFATKNITERDTTWAMTPKWLFNKGVPLVAFPETVNPLGQTTKRYFPYYFDENYKFYFHRMLTELGKYINALPADLRKRILFIQSAEGSTGDGSPYKGKPIDPKYNITKKQWSQFRVETWEKMVEAFSKNGELQTPLLTNYDSNDEKEYNWILEKLPKAVGLKNGMFSHGYHISNAQERLENFNKFRKAVEANGKVFFARGEQDKEYRVHGWSKQNIPQGLYWSALYATHCGLTLWNVPWDACDDKENFPALKLFNRYAAQTNPETADYAFNALRRGLDAADVTQFPENEYGEATKKNTDRYLKIAEQFKSFGAQMSDVKKAIYGGMKNRKRKGFNDVGWKILTTNYKRHLTQIDPEETSVALWNVDQSIYGRFARRFDYSSGKNAFYFDLDDLFFGKHATKEKSGVKIKIIYHDSEVGSWDLMYHASKGKMKKAITQKTNGTSKWLETTIELKDALFTNGGEKGADIIIKNSGTGNTIFHLIEVDKKGVSYK